MWHAFGGKERSMGWVVLKEELFGDECIANPCNKVVREVVFVKRIDDTGNGEIVKGICEINGEEKNQMIRVGVEEGTDLGMGCVNRSACDKSMSGTREQLSCSSKSLELPCQGRFVNGDKRILNGNRAQFVWCGDGFPGMFGYKDYSCSVESDPVFWRRLDHCKGQIKAMRWGETCQGFTANGMTICREGSHFFQLIRKSLGLRSFSEGSRGVKDKTSGLLLACAA